MFFEKITNQEVSVTTTISDYLKYEIILILFYVLFFSLLFNSFFNLQYCISFAIN